MSFNKIAVEIERYNSCSTKPQPAIFGFLEANCQSYLGEGNLIFCFTGLTDPNFW